MVFDGRLLVLLTVTAPQVPAHSAKGLYTLPSSAVSLFQLIIQEGHSREKEASN